MKEGRLHEINESNEWNNSSHTCYTCSMQLFRTLRSCLCRLNATERPAELFYFTVRMASWITAMMRNKMQLYIICVEEEDYTVQQFQMADGKDCLATIKIWNTSVSIPMHCWSCLEFRRIWFSTSSTLLRAALACRQKDWNHRDRRHPCNRTSRLQRVHHRPWWSQQFQLP